jgi:hypothetical protein
MNNVFNLGTFAARRESLEIAMIHFPPRLRGAWANPFVRCAVATLTPPKAPLYGRRKPVSGDRSP